jgi:hypothetical protein
MMNDIQKLQVLLAHWVEHNREHGEEFRQWAQRAEEFGSGEVASRLEMAAQKMTDLNDSLRAARNLLEGFTS